MSYLDGADLSNYVDGEDGGKGGKNKNKENDMVTFGYDFVKWPDPLVLTDSESNDTIGNQDKDP